ncbi:MAG: hypothetical protein PHV16_03650, partial [Candidatus Nanoarchaeia archaeon]|nr:hypothetical protein [Candidatus Nanoarchaeia archaeon]
MKKRGQVTMFIIAGIAVLAFIVLFLYAQNINLNDANVIPLDETKPINHYVGLCAKSTTEDALFKLGIQGGYTSTPPNYMQSVYSKIAYWYYEGEDISPSIKKMEQELSLYVDKALPECIENLDVFREMGYNFEFNDIKTKAKISDNFVEFNINYPITIIKQNSKAKISDFYEIYNVRLGHIHNISKQIVEKEVEDPLWIDISFLMLQDVKFDIYPYDNKTIIYSVVDEQSKLSQGKNFTFL